MRAGFVATIAIKTGAQGVVEARQRILQHDVAFRFSIIAVLDQELLHIAYAFLAETNTTILEISKFFFLKLLKKSLKKINTYSNI